jgi:cytochrome P450
MSIDLRAIDNSLMDPSWYTKPDYHEAFRVLRDEDPVHYVEAENYDRSFWSVTRHEDVKWCLGNPQLLSSREGARMPRVPSRTTAERRVEMGYDTRLDYLDDPMHSVYRRPLNKHFSVPAVKKLSAGIASYIHEIIDEIEDETEFDFVDAVATRLPVMVVATLLGVPREDWPHLQTLSSRIIESHDPRYTVGGDPLATFRAAYSELMDYAVDLIEDRRRNPRDDFASVLGQMKADHEPLSLREARTSVIALVLGGFDTTRHALGVGVWQLLKNPEQRRILLDEPGAVMGGVDETIRWSTPARSVTRVANEDFKLRDSLIRAGDWVSLLLISANRDERVFERPLEFDVRRSPNDYLSFGEGIHKCLGRNLIRLELASFLPLVFNRLPGLEIVREPHWLRDTGTSGLADLKLWSGKVVRDRVAA